MRARQKGPDLRRDYDIHGMAIYAIELSSQKGPDLRRDYDCSRVDRMGDKAISVRRDLIYEGITTLYESAKDIVCGCQKGPDLRRDYDQVWRALRGLLGLVSEGT